MARLTKEEQKIKKKFGEDMLKLCRELELTGLTEQVKSFNYDEIENLLFDILSTSFAPSNYLSDVLYTSENREKFKVFIYTKVGERGYRLGPEDERGENLESKEYSIEDVAKMFDAAGYFLFPECKTEAEVQAFRQYYDRLGRGETPIFSETFSIEQFVGDELCTFNGGRLNDARVWFAMKKEVYENKFAIPRQPIPLRDDIYGTSVLSIQWTKGNCPTLSIKNRYNHNITDSNPDSTLSNNLDNIYPGLHTAFCSAFGINVKFDQRHLNMEDFVLANDGKFHLVNTEYNGVRFCDNNSIIYPDGTVKSLDPGEFVVVDSYVIRLKNPPAVIEEFQDPTNISKGQKHMLKGAKIVKNKETGERTIELTCPNGDIVNLTLNKRNQVLKMASPNMQEMPKAFLKNLRNINELDFPVLEKIDAFCFHYCKCKKIFFPNLKRIGASCFIKSECVELYLPKVVKIGANSFDICNSLVDMYAPLLRDLRQGCFMECINLSSINLPSLKIMQGGCFMDCPVLERAEMQSLEKKGRMCFYRCDNLKDFIAPQLKEDDDKKKLSFPFIDIEAFESEEDSFCKKEV